MSSLQAPACVFLCSSESQLVANEIVKEISRTLSTDLQMALNTLDPSLSEKICFIINS